MDTELCFSLLLDSIRCRVVAVSLPCLPRLCLDIQQVGMPAYAEHLAGETPASPVLAPPPDPLPEGAGELWEVAPCS